MKFQQNQPAIALHLLARRALRPRDTQRFRRVSGNNSIAASGLDGGQEVQGDVKGLADQLAWDSRRTPKMHCPRKGLRQCASATRQKRDEMSRRAPSANLAYSSRDAAVHPVEGALKSVGRGVQAKQGAAKGLLTGVNQGGCV